MMEEVMCDMLVVLTLIPRHSFGQQHHALALYYATYLIIDHKCCGLKHSCFL